MTTTTPANEEKRAALARRLIWWKTPEKALEDRNRLLAQVMTLGTWNDIVEAKEFWSRADFREALRNAPAGVFDPRSWSYWHHLLDLLPVPPRPTRKLPNA